MSRRKASPEWAAEAVRSTVLRGIVGSTAHGVSTGDDDIDEMAVCIPLPEWTFGLSPETHYVYRDAKEGQRSGPGDLDLTVYTLRRYISLLTAKANPTCQMLLWLPESMLTHTSTAGEELRAMRHLTLSQQLGWSFLWYMRHQRERMTGVRGQKRVTRPELVERYGYDTKYAGHVIRLGLQGIELACDGKLTLPMKEEDRQLVLDVRRGKHSQDEVVAISQGLEDRLQRNITNLPEHPGAEELEAWMLRSYFLEWEGMNVGVSVP